MSPSTEPGVDVENKATSYTAALDLPVEHVQPGWLFLFGEKSAEVAETRDNWHDCLEAGCVALGFTTDLLDVIDELLATVVPLDADLSEPDESWLHFHAGDSVQVRIPCEVKP